MTTIETDETGFTSWRTARWVAPLFAIAALMLVPWIVVLATRLLSRHAAPHWNLTWAGFDVALTLLLIAVADAAWRCSRWLEGAATAAAALLLVDAWFDVTTSSPGLELTTSLAEALLIELPIAILCLLIARDAERVLARSVAPRSYREAKPRPTFDAGYLASPSASSSSAVVSRVSVRALNPTQQTTTGYARSSLAYSALRAHGSRRHSSASSSRLPTRCGRWRPRVRMNRRRG